MATTIHKKQAFRLVAHAAHRVQLVGDFTNWQPIPMIKGADGTWRATVMLPVGKHQYLFILDGNLCEDPDCSERAPNPTGGSNMVRVVE